ncbi:MAG: RsmG family class I SAM-dependent methyltransferase [Balneolaceae bacterium]|nr:RsmG family class I SAM-dependent methyltransferase [Balneolaceae bacterium]
MEHHQITYQTVSRETFSSIDNIIEKNRDALERYLDQLFWWNERVNLVSRDVSRGTVWEHIRHSLILTQFAPFRDSGSVVDTGTGGGLPGIPLAIAAPDKQYLLNDIVSKKIIAVRQILLKIGLENATAEARSVSELDIPSSALLVSKHAFKIDQLWDMVSEKPWSSLVFYKGVEFENEAASIKDPLDIACYDLSHGSDFYEGKVLIFVTRL